MVQKEGKSAETFPTQRQAVEAARRTVRNKTASQLVIHFMEETAGFENMKHTE